MALVACACLFTAPALAQASDTLPRFEALEMQQQMNDQRQLDTLEADRQRDLNKSALPNSGVTAAQRALIDQQYEDQRQKLLLQMQNERALKQREQDIAAAALPNTHVPAYSSAVVTDPARYILPPAPPNQYYARIDGRFVLVDRTSELVVSVLPVQPTDPVADVPTGPRPMPAPGLPLRRIAPTSSLVITNYATLGLPAPPGGQYYAGVDGVTVLVDRNTEMAVKLVPR
ncbi:MAG: RcnB family protein [Hyphomonadaceae bacterium]